MSNLGANLQLLPAQLSTLLTDPTSNLTAALVLYGIIALFVIILLIGAIMFIMSSPDDETAGPDQPKYDDGYGYEFQEGGAGDSQAPEASAAQPGQTGRPSVVAKLPRTPRQRLTSFLIALGVIAAVWVMAGYTTSNSAVCASCHSQSPHAAADRKSDPHAGVSCVECHEPGGALGRYAGNVPSRLTHFIDRATGTTLQAGYGRATASACSSCHASTIAKTTIDRQRGIRMSHKEPLSASATCVDCHALQAGVVSSRTVGMNPCLRCHDSKRAPATCATCHDKKASNAARVRTITPAVQVPNVKCGGCHDEKKECDTCHGTRMPHTTEFMAYAHARAGAVDLYYNGGKACGKCHTATRRPCSKCHTPLLGHGHGSNNLVTHSTAAEVACNTCHQQWARDRNRDFCKDLCHSPAAVAASPR